MRKPSQRADPVLYLCCGLPLFLFSVRQATCMERQAEKLAALRRILYVRNLPFNISADEMYDIFGKFGAVRQIRLCATRC